jgi:hypothetical protein
LKRWTSKNFWVRTGALLLEQIRPAGLELAQRRNAPMGKHLGMTILFATMLFMGVALGAKPAAAQGGTVIASDNFNRPDETPFAVGGNWGRVVAGNYDGYSKLVNSQVTNGPNEGIYYWQGPGTFDNTRQFARHRVVEKVGEIGLVLLGGPDHAIMLNWGAPGVNDNVYIYWYSNGIDRGVLAVVPSTLNNGDIAEAVLEGGVIYAKVNGVTVASVANTTTLTSGTPGFITYGDVNLPALVGIIDDWEGGTPVSYAISGTVTEGAAGLGGVQVTASGGFSGSATTNGVGAYSITGVPPGATAILLTPTLPGHTMTPLTLTVAGPVAGNVTGEDFTSTLNSTATLTIHAQHGSVTKSPDQPTYVLGTGVTLTAVPDAGYVFTGWSGDVPAGHETDNPLLVVMDQDRDITAGFVAPGAVTFDNFNRADETPLAVGGNWQSPFGSGTANLTGNHVVGVTGEALYYWQGPGTFENARQFARATVVQADGQAGLVLLGASNQALVTSWAGGTLYIYWYAAGNYQGNLTTVPSTLQAGDIIEAQLDGGTITARLNGAVVASVANTTALSSGRPGFEMYMAGGGLDNWVAGTSPAPSPVEILASAGPGGTITPSGTVSADYGSSPAFTITPDAGYVVADVLVNGASQGPLTNYTFTNVITNQTIAASFAADLRALTIQVVGGGTVAKSPNLPAFPQGSKVQLTANPASGWAFSAWSGGLVSTNNPDSVLMDTDKTVTATFVDVAGPSVAVTSPNGAEVLLAGSTTDITWTASDNAAVTTIDVELSRTGAGGPYELLASSVPNSGTYSWLVTAPVTEQALVRVTAHDAAGNTAQDVSDAEFSIGGVAGVFDGPVTVVALSSMWPSPVRSSTRFQFALPREASVHIGLHDVQGRELQVLADGAFGAGRHQVEWSNTGRAALRPGLYFVRMTVPGSTIVRRFLLTM